MGRWRDLAEIKTQSYWWSATWEAHRTTRASVRGPDPAWCNCCAASVKWRMQFSQQALSDCYSCPLVSQFRVSRWRFRAAALTDVIAELKAKYGMVVLDLPAVLNNSDTQVLARLADQLVVVVRAGVTPSKLVRQALDELPEETILGVVLNDSGSELPAWLENRL